MNPPYLRSRLCILSRTLDHLANQYSDFLLRKQYSASGSQATTDYWLAPQLHNGPAVHPFSSVYSGKSDICPAD